MRKFLVVSLVALLAVASYAAGVTFTLTSDAGVQPSIVGITQAKFPPPGVARDPIVAPLVTFDCVDFNLIGYVPAKPATETSPAVAEVPGTREWYSWKRVVRADVIVGLEAARDEYAGYTAVYTSAAFDVSDKVLDGDVFFVKGDVKTQSAIVAQVMGKKVINATFDEAR